MPPRTRLDALRVVPLDDPAARDPERTGAKASALARAAYGGLRTLPGFVLPPPLVDAFPAPTQEADALPAAVLDDLHSAWLRLSADGRDPVIVRSSSAAEDQEEDAAAGRFRTVPDVRDWHGFLGAVREVAASRSDAGAAGEAPLAVLVQPMLDVTVGGVLFGLDPVTGREDRVVVSVTRGQPERLVSGEVEGTRYELDRRGVVHSSRRGPDGARLGRRALRRLARLADRAADVFGGPQDVEWALDDSGRLWLLQSRPVTTQRRGTPVGPVLGRGPVAETFPEPLSVLERDLWLEPVRQALTSALSAVRAVPSAQLETSPVVTAVSGHAVVDLELLGAHRDPTWQDRLDPRPAVRRLTAAWRVGRLRTALPRLCTELLDRTDAELGAVPAPGTLTTRQLLGLLHRSRQALVAVHTHEALVGMVLDPAAEVETGTSVALRVLARARQDALDDEEIVERYPIVLALVAPRVGRAPVLPETPGPVPEDRPHTTDGHDMALLREALRVRTRWLQELSARAAAEIGGRLVLDGVLSCEDDVRHLPLEALGHAVVSRRPVRRTASGEHGLEEVPATFRLSDTGDVVPVHAGARSATGAGGGRGTGPAHHGRQPPEGAVLVVTVLDPAIAPLLDRLAGLVAETGDPLAHLAILARQAGVPSVVGCAGARERFPEGAQLEVDGTTGDVRRVDEEEDDR